MTEPRLLCAHRPGTTSSGAKLRAQSERLVFAFARGTDEDSLIQLFEPVLPEALQLQDDLSEELTLKELCERSFLSFRATGAQKGRLARYVRKVLLAPPRETAEIEFRQDIFRELLGDAELRAALQSLLAELADFRSALCGSELPGAKSQSLRRRVDILAAFRRILQQAQRLPTSRSGLGRLADWATEVCQLPEYKTLEQLMDFESRYQTIDARLALGQDGRMRHFEVLGSSKLEHPALLGSRRFRIVRALGRFLRGERYREEDLLAILLDQVFSSLEAQVKDLLMVGLELELLLALTDFYLRAASQGLAHSLPVVGRHGDGRTETRFQELWNPWLWQKDKLPVALDFELPTHQPISLLTGPNSGGKTRLLQAVAYAQLLGQGGFPVPAASASLVPRSNLCVSIREFSLSDQGEGRLGAELLRIRRLFELAAPDSLILLDELCSGTNPSEGEELFLLVLELLTELRASVMISTHFLDLAQSLEAKGADGTRFLRVETDEAERPTYRFVSGVAKTSLAKRTAERLGVTRDELKRLLSARSRQLEAKLPSAASA